MLTKEKQLKKQILLMITAIVLIVAGIRLYLDINHNKEIFDSKVQRATEHIQTVVALEQKKTSYFLHFTCQIFFKQQRHYRSCKNERSKQTL